MHMLLKPKLLDSSLELPLSITYLDIILSNLDLIMSNNVDIDRTASSPHT